MVDRLPAAAWTWRLPVSRPLTLSTWGLAMPSLQEKDVRWNNDQPVRSPHPHPPPPPPTASFTTRTGEGAAVLGQSPLFSSVCWKGVSVGICSSGIPLWRSDTKKTCAQLCNCTNRKWRLWHGHLRSCCALFQTFEWNLLLKRFCLLPEDSPCFFLYWQDTLLPHRLPIQMQCTH